MAVRTIIPGPPGTGKTYRLVNHYLSNEINSLQTSAQRIIYITFSKAAAKEARERIEELFPNQDFLYISTMHSLGTKECGIKTSERLLNGKKKWNLFKNYPTHEAYRNMSFEVTTDAAGNKRYQNPNMQIIQYARAKKIELEEAALQLGKHDEVNIDFTHQLEQDLKSFKEDTGMVEFSDMIKLFVEKKKCPSLDVVFLDEAQDLSPSQWDMFFYIEKQCERSYIAGDDDQTIYTFQGADPNIFINLEGVRDDQKQSRRVPRKIHSKALEIFPQLSNRLDKEWFARDAEGEVHENCILDELDFTKENWMILARTNKLLEEIGEHFFALGIRFSGKTNTFLPNKLLDAYRIWDRLNKGAHVSGDEAIQVYEFLRKHQIKHGYGSGKTLSNVNSIDLDGLKDSHGLLVSGSWEQLHMPEDTRNYIKNLLEKGDDLMSDSRIELCTIHGSKGRERNNIVLFTDFGTDSQGEFIYREAYRNPDPEHRLFFVGITRAKNKLFIMAPKTDYYYTIGDPII